MCGSGIDSRRTIKSVGETRWKQVNQWENTWPSPSLETSTAARKMWQMSWKCAKQTAWMCLHQSLLLSQALSTTYQGPSPSSRQDMHVNVRGLSWRWSAIFTLPGVSKTMTSVTADGWETAAYGSPSTTPGSAVEASQRQGCAHLDSLTRWHTFTEPIAIGSLK